MTDYKDSFGIMIPKSFIAQYGNCSACVHFEYKDKWDNFKIWIMDGNLKQLKLDSTLIDVWVRISDIVGLNPASLQEHFDQYCKPKKPYGFTSYETNTTPNKDY